MQSLNPVFVEDWLEICCQNSSSRLSVSSPAAPPSSATEIIQAWSQIRNCLQEKNFQPQHLLPFRTLVSSRFSLRVADSQARLLLSALSFSFPPELAPDFCSLILRLLYIWARKSVHGNVSLLESAVSSACDLFCHSGYKGKFVGEGILFLGAVSAVPILPESSRKLCLEMVLKLLDEQGSGHVGGTTEVLSGIGYSLFSSQMYEFDKIINWFLNVWDSSCVFCACVSHGLMIFHLMEWLASRCISSGFWEKIELLLARMGEKTRGGDDGVVPSGVQFTLIMSAGGVLRGLNRGNGGKDIVSRLRKSADNVIDTIISCIIVQSLGRNPAGEFDYFDHGSSSTVLRCIALCLCRTGPISFRANVLTCLVLALLHEVFPLIYFYGQIVTNSSESLAAVVAHLESILFKEAGTLTRILCNLYVLANEEQKSLVENCIWNYCDKVYSKQRRFAYTFGEKSELLKGLEKIGESAFLMIVIFASTATKHKASTQPTGEIQLGLSWRTLSAFSCIEYFRRVRISEYAETVRRSVLCIKDDTSACSSLVEMLPSYAEITRQGWNMNYVWFKDEVQTARILFYLRVLPPCAEKIPTSLIQKILAPMVFLYMHHPEGKVARASHSLFLAFMSSGKDAFDDHRTLLKEQLAFYYMQRALEGYPGVTPFEGMASGVVTLIRNLPAGCPGIFYCVNSIIEKARIMSQGNEPTENQQECSEPCKKLLEFLPRLILLVDIQVLPGLLKLLAQLIVHLRGHPLTIVLDGIYALVAESDDVTRKPLLVSWVHSVTYLSSQAGKNNSSNSHTNILVGKGLDVGDGSSQTAGISPPNKTWGSYFFPGSRL
ncbi:uncharacterized protein LOC116262355 [Nymphaea colorata]|nr:uncharacterized protein LOC116262355 [Nymphaea colorata]